MNKDIESISKLIEAITTDVNGLVLDGDLYAIEAIVLAKKLENAAKQIREDWEEEALVVTESWKGQAFAGYTATQKDGSRRYTFKHLTDWTDLNAKQKAIELVSKNAYIQAQLGNIIVDEDGVIVPQAEPVKTKQSIVLTRIK